MGWRCRNCGNTESFIETNKVQTRVRQDTDTRIRKTIHEFPKSPLLSVKCEKCLSTFVEWVDLEQDRSYVFDNPGFVTQDHEIDCMMLELSTKCNLKCASCPKGPDNFIDFSLVKRLIEENFRLENPIRQFELGWDMGNPCLHPDFEKIARLLLSHGAGVNVLTNALDFQDVKSASYSFWLDHPNQAINDEMMGGAAYEKTLAALDQLKGRAAIIMRMSAGNHDQLPKMLDLAKRHGAGLIPTEIYPLGKAEDNMLMTDPMKEQVVRDIEALGLMRSIHYSKPTATSGCTYLRSKRMAIDAQGNLNFCHFLTSLPNSRIISAENLSMLEIIQKNNQVRNSFNRNKQKKFPGWTPKRKNVSSCSYCLHAFGLDKRW